MKACKAPPFSTLYYQMEKLDNLQAKAGQPVTGLSDSAGQVLVKSSATKSFHPW